MSAPVCGFHCHWKHWRSLAASSFCCYFAASPTHSGLFRDFPQCFIACSWVRWCTQIETMEHGSIIRTHLLIDYKEYADVSFTDSLKPTGSSNMAHHQFSMQHVWVVSQCLRLTRRRSGSSCTPPPRVSPCSIYCSFRLSAWAKPHPPREIVLMSIRIFIFVFIQVPMKVREIFSMWNIHRHILAPMINRWLALRFWRWN